MKNFFSLLTICVICTAFMFSGCGGQKADTSQEAISIAKAMETTKGKTDYLISQANAFIKADDFRGAIDIANFILRYLDSNSGEAKFLLDRAKSDLVAQYKKTGDAVKKSFAGFGQK